MRTRIQRAMCAAGFCSLPTPERKRLGTLLFSLTGFVALVMAVQLYDNGVHRKAAAAERAMMHSPACLSQAHNEENKHKGGSE